MLSVQSGMNYGPAFGASRRRTERQLTPEELEARKYSENRRELLEQKEELEDLAESKDFKLPEPANYRFIGRYGNRLGLEKVFGCVL